MEFDEGIADSIAAAEPVRIADSLRDASIENNNVMAQTSAVEVQAVSEDTGSTVSVDGKLRLHRCDVISL